MKQLLLTTILAVMLSPCVSAQRTSQIGQIRMFAFHTFMPTGFAHGNGRILSIAEYPELFNIIGTRYGGDGQTSFRLPDLRNAEKQIAGVRYVIAVKEPDDEMYVGEVRMIFATTLPNGTMECNGQGITITQNQNIGIYSVLGTAYGGDGRTFINLPDLRAKRDSLKQLFNHELLMFVIATEGKYPNILR